MVKNPPSAIICGNDVIAQGVMFACYSMSIHIPNDLSIAGIGDFGGSEHLEPGLTTVRLPSKRIGRTAADTLLSMSEKGIPPFEFHVSVPLDLVFRGSTGF